MEPRHVKSFPHTKMSEKCVTAQNSLTNVMVSESRQFRKPIRISLNNKRSDQSPSYCHEKILHKSNVKKEEFALAHGWRDTVPCGRKAWKQEGEAAGLIEPPVRKQGEMNAGAQLTVSFVSFKHLLIFLCLDMCVGTCAKACVWSSENNLWELGLRLTIWVSGI